jgi:preprotein translocase subunit SecG
LLAYILYGLFILSCIVLVVVILLQPGKADAGALFSSSVSSTAFGPRGTQTILAKITIGAAAAFMLCALALGLPAIMGTRSVLQSEPESAPQQTQPATPTAPANPNPATQTAPAQPPADAGSQTAPQTNANAAAAPASANATANAPAASKNANSKQNQKPPAKK